MSKLLMGILAAMGLWGYLYYQTAIVPMKNKIEEQTAVILAQDLRDQEQKAAIAAIKKTLRLQLKLSEGYKLEINKQKNKCQSILTSFADIISPR